MRYNIVLAPSLHQRRFYEELSKNYFSEIHSGYLLGQGSIPHITLCQFECEESEVKKIFKQFYCEFNQLSCYPEFSGLSIMKLGGQFSGLQAAELSVVRNKNIMELHRNTVEFIRTRGMQPLNAVGDLYRPHLTLAFFDPVKASAANIPLSLPSDIFGNQKFEVVIGLADINWQFNKIIKESDIHLFLKSQCGYLPENIDLFADVQKKLGVTLHEFLEGKIFSKDLYSQKEIKLILSDLKQIVFDQFSPESYNNHPVYLTTSGAPGSGKSFYIESVHGSNPSYAVYIDPDRVGLPALSGYLRDKKKYGDSYAYAKWRDASNFIANFMLVKACAESRNIIHGTTASNYRIIQIYQALKSLGYKIQVELLFANAQQRALAVKYREKEVIQVTANDFIGKSKPIFFRINDAYLVHCDKVNFHFQNGSFWLGYGQLVKFASFNKNDNRLNIGNTVMMRLFHDEMNTELSPKDAQEVESSLQNSGVHFVYEPKLILKQQLFPKFYYDFFRAQLNDSKKESKKSSAVVPYKTFNRIQF